MQFLFLRVAFYCPRLSSRSFLSNYITTDEDMLMGPRLWVGKLLYFEQTTAIVVNLPTDVGILKWPAYVITNRGGFNLVS